MLQKSTRTRPNFSSPDGVLQFSSQDRTAGGFEGGELPHLSLLPPAFSTDGVR